jgi:hypothetical protein
MHASRHELNGISLAIHLHIPRPDESRIVFDYAKPPQQRMRALDNV